MLFPLLGIMSGKETAPSYINSTIVLFIGGFMIALTMQRWNLHRRIALNIIRLVGGGPARIVLGFMIAAAFLSMWISNTATAVTMVPMGLAIVLQVEERLGAGSPAAHRFSVALMLGIAYGCSVGGMTTLVGTPPNLSLVRIFEIMFPEGPEHRLRAMDDRRLPGRDHHGADGVVRHHPPAVPRTARGQGRSRRWSIGSSSAWGR